MSQTEVARDTGCKDRQPEVRCRTSLSSNFWMTFVQLYCRNRMRKQVNTYKAYFQSNSGFESSINVYQLHMTTIAHPSSDWSLGPIYCSPMFVGPGVGLFDQDADFGQHSTSVDGMEILWELHHCGRCYNCGSIFLAMFYSPYPYNSSAHRILGTPYNPSLQHFCHVVRGWKLAISLKLCGWRFSRLQHLQR